MMSSRPAGATALPEGRSGIADAPAEGVSVCLSVPGRSSDHEIELAGGARSGRWPG
jgi:hypothetical protein